VTFLSLTGRTTAKRYRHNRLKHGESETERERGYFVLPKISKVLRTDHCQDERFIVTPYKKRLQKTVGKNVKAAKGEIKSNWGWRPGTRKVTDGR